MTGLRVGCVIPAYEAAPTLGDVVAGLRTSLPNALVVVVDDGSTDETERVARSTADATLRFARNRGKGAALRAGFVAALEWECDVVLTVDADGQHDTACAPSLLAALEFAEMAIGARARTPGTMPLGRRVTNRLAAAAVARCVGRPVDDAQSGYRAIRAALLREIIPPGDRYEYETEFLILAARRGFRVAFVPVPTRYPGTVPSRFRAVRDSARIVSTLWRFHRSADC